MEKSFQFKGGAFTLTVLHLNTTDLHQLESDLAQKIAQSPMLFKQMPIIVDLSQLDGRGVIDLKWLKNLLLAQKIIPVGLQNVPTNLTQRAEEADWGILHQGQAASRKSEPVSEPIQEEVQATPVEEPPLYTPPCETAVTTNQIRSGQQLYQQQGDIIIINTVNVGAEILADGNIHIYGALRGRALAGVNGDTNARIFCQSLEAELVSIAGKYKVIEEFSEEWRGHAVQIYLDENEELCIERL